jgi:lipid II isoglutaminyl synthase (glutamine-hydrolysing)
MVLKAGLVGHECRVAVVTNTAFAHGVSSLVSEDTITVSCGYFRVERMTKGGREVRLALARNPGGYTDLLRALLGDGQPKHMLLALNVRSGGPGRPGHPAPAGCGRPDVSWIWDVDFESLRALACAAVVSGNRAADLAVRLKYAGWLGTGAGAGQADIAVEPDPVRGFQVALARTPAGQPVWALSNSLILDRLRGWLLRQGYASTERERTS